ncbi:MAG: hypothetical protein WAS26_17325 [Paracoccaceae bacterium]
MSSASKSVNPAGSALAVVAMTICPPVCKGLPDIGGGRSAPSDSVRSRAGNASESSACLLSVAGDFVGLKMDSGEIRAVFGTSGRLCPLIATGS